MPTFGFNGMQGESMAGPYILTRQSLLAPFVWSALIEIRSYRSKPYRRLSSFGVIVFISLFVNELNLNANMADLFRNTNELLWRNPFKFRLGVLNRLGIGK